MLRCRVIHTGLTTCCPKNILDCLIIKPSENYVQARAYLKKRTLFFARNTVCVQKTVMSSKAATTGKCEHISTEEVARGKWLALNNITYKNPDGKERKWEAISRTTKNTGEADAIGVIAVFKDPSQQCDCIVLVRQYRPPLKAYTIEFPAGLIDAGETAAEAAVREMKEETGYEVTVDTVLPASSLDGGVGETTLKIVLCKLDGEAEINKNPKTIDGGSWFGLPNEFVQVRVEPLSSLLNKLNEYSAAGDVVDSRVYSWAVGRMSV